jgi:uncharacterized protein YfiM (DUF2279 family)
MEHDIGVQQKRQFTAKYLQKSPKKVILTSTLGKLTFFSIGKYEASGWSRPNLSNPFTSV